MDNEFFLYLISNQQKWRNEYLLQQKQKRKDHNAVTREKKYYGNSKQYQAKWRREGAQIYK